jgi:MFS family permease
MRYTAYLKKEVAKWPYVLVTILTAISAFGTYTCMYAFRKAFAAATFSNLEFLNIDFKVWLIISQVLGYTFSKFYGIKFISEMNNKSRGKSILALIGISWLALLGFALVSPPWNIFFLFLNGFPLGMIWGLVFGYLEGRKSTEFMASVLAVSMVFASGFVKTIGRILINLYYVSEFWMPFITGALFILPLLVFVLFLEIVPAPSDQDIILRAKRSPMNSYDRKVFLRKFLPGIVLTLIIYVLLTMMRDVRDNFEVEIWSDLGVHSNTIYANIDSLIAVIVLIAMSFLIVIRNNIRAFAVIHLMIIAGCIIMGVSTVLFSHNLIGPVSWMILAGLGLYMGYLPYNAIFFERMIACFKYKSNVGFLMYFADALGYLGSISILLIKQFGNPSVTWGYFFREGVIFVALIGGTSATFSFIYFLKKAHRHRNKTTSKTSFQLSV